MSVQSENRFQTTPFWTAGLSEPLTGESDLPAKSDVAIIGGGIAGFAVAAALATNGTRVCVLEKGAIATGASRRAAGALGNLPKASIAALSSLYGLQAAKEIYAEARSACRYAEELIDKLDIDCDLQRNGRFVAAHSRGAFDRLQRTRDATAEFWDDTTLISKSDQRRFVATDRYFGGVHFRNAATLNPAKFTFGLVSRATALGVQAFPYTRIGSILRHPLGFDIETSRGPLKATNVVMATNAYDDDVPSLLTPLSRKLLPIPAYALASEQLDPASIRRILPAGSAVSDTYKLLHYIAPSPDQSRLIFSGRAGREEGGLAKKASRILRYFSGVVPEIGRLRVSHCWSGKIAMTRDLIPHVGQHNGIHYILGCCGTGIAMFPWLGKRLAEAIDENADCKSAFARPLPSFPMLRLARASFPVLAQLSEFRDRFLR